MRFLVAYAPRNDRKNNKLRNDREESIWNDKKLRNDRKHIEITEKQGA
ncbi:hypothetical protein [Thermodesulfovibrio sp.]